LLTFCKNFILFRIASFRVQFSRMVVSLQQASEQATVEMVVQPPEHKIIVTIPRFSDYYVDKVPTTTMDPSTVDGWLVEV